MLGEVGRRKDRLHEEPLPEGEDWVEWGGELVCAQGFTEGGAPYGLSVDEFRAVTEDGDREAGWARAKSAFRRVFQRPGADVEVGWVRRLGEGLSRDVFTADIQVSPDPDQLSGAYAALVPRRDAGPAVSGRALREALLLRRLATTPLPFRIPRRAWPVRDGPDVVLVREALRGLPLDLRAGRRGSARPWETVGRIAAAVHELPIDHLPERAAGPLTCREHRLEIVRSAEGIDRPELRDAISWLSDHVDVGRPAVLLHGDLLGQNILLGIDEPDAVIDWELARPGDPAYDLAIVTRGVKKPFQIPEGLTRLLGSYRASGGSVTEIDVLFFEIGLALGWFRDSLTPVLRAEPPEQALARVRALLRRASSSALQPERRSSFILKL